MPQKTSPTRYGAEEGREEEEEEEEEEAPSFSLSLSSYFYLLLCLVADISFPPSLPSSLSQYVRSSRKLVGAMERQAQQVLVTGRRMVGGKWGGKDGKGEDGGGGGGTKGGAG